jgi:hypothetical protein
MYREYFITTPLILNKVIFRYGNCRIVMRGNEAKSYIEGPTHEMVDNSFNFEFALRDKAHIPGLRFWLRSTSDEISFPKNPREIRGEAWPKWAFSNIPLDSIPAITLSEKECESIQQEINGYVRESLEHESAGIA